MLWVVGALLAASVALIGLMLLPFLPRRPLEPGTVSRRWVAGDRES